MKIAEGTIEKLITDFEQAALIDEHGIEFWYARDFQALLGYDKWERFARVIDKAKNTCMTSGNKMSDHFAGVDHNMKLTRYACYLIAQNADSRKKPVAFAQTYFAIQTRRQEIQDTKKKHPVAYSEDQKRWLLRDEIKMHNKRLASAAKNAGVIEPKDFSAFQNFGYMGLYGNLDRRQIAVKKGIEPNKNLLDHMESTELAANLFRATQTEDKLVRENIKGKVKANFTHYDVGHKVRQAIKNIGGTMPEDLPPAEDIVKVGRRLHKTLRDDSKTS